MIRWMSLLLLAVLAGGVYADDFNPVPPPPPGERTESDEEAREQAEARRRRYEIMVLLQAYRILPEEQKPALKEEILKRLRSDYIANRQRLAVTIERMEQELARLKALAAREEDAATAVNGEFERLLKMPIGGMGPEGWIHPPRRDRDDEGRQGMKPNRVETRGRFREVPPPEKGGSEADVPAVAGE